MSGSVSETAGAITDPKQIFVVRRYLNKLNPKQDRLFQRACYGTTVLQQDRDVWFMNAALGHNMLAKFMHELSVAANLSTTYTNHCVRVTTIVNLKSAGFEDEKICAVSGHKNVQSLNAYVHPTSDDMKALAKAVYKDSVSSLQPTSAGNPIDSGSSSTAAVLNAAGSTWNHVTVNIMQPMKRKRHLSLKLNKKPKKEGR